MLTFEQVHWNLLLQVEFFLYGWRRGAAPCAWLLALGLLRRRRGPEWRVQACGSGRNLPVAKG
jgi:hypothetical protein